MEIATVLIWILRIVLPVVLFWIYFKFQSPKDESYPGPTKNQVPKQKMLAVREVVVNAAGPCPPSMQSIQLVDEATAPSLFNNKARPKKERPDRPRREKRDKDGDDGEPREERKSRKEKQGAKDEAEVEKVEDKMHLESLMNYVAFNRKEQQRTFLPDEGCAPPPPPMKPPGDKKEGLLNISAADSTKANEEAQMVLRGAITFKRSFVAKDLYDQLTESNVEIAERTFALMIESCIHVSDLKNASDFLMKMEAAGYCPDSDLLDKVMDLYAQHKLSRELEKQVPAVPDAAMSLPSGAMFNFEGALPQGPAEMDDGERAKLSSDAPIFVPMFAGSDSKPQPPPPPLPQSSDDAGGQRTGLNPAAVPFTWEAPIDDSAAAMQRTALSATAMPFQPQGNTSFDPSAHTWTSKMDTEGDMKDSNRKKKARPKGVPSNAQPPAWSPDQPPPPPGPPPAKKKSQDAPKKKVEQEDSKGKGKGKDKGKAKAKETPVKTPKTIVDEPKEKGSKTWKVKESPGTGGTD